MSRHERKQTYTQNNSFTYCTPVVLIEGAERGVTNLQFLQLVSLCVHVFHQAGWPVFYSGAK